MKFFPAFIIVCLAVVGLTLAVAWLIGHGYITEVRDDSNLHTALQITGIALAMAAAVVTLTRKRKAHRP